MQAIATMLTRRRSNNGAFDAFLLRENEAERQ
jgi:hypothetical protein